MADQEWSPEALKRLLADLRWRTVIDWDFCDDEVTRGWALMVQHLDGISWRFLLTIPRLGISWGGL